jgi:RNA polymerase sigma-B factor
MPSTNAPTGTGHATLQDSARVGPSAAADAERFARLQATGDRRLRDELILEHRWIAERCASRFSGRGEPYEDLVQVAMLALVKAIDRYDASLGGTFPRYAIPSVTGELRRHFRDHTWRMSVSRRAKDLGSLVNAALDTLVQQLGRSPTPAELASYMGQPLDHVLETLDARNAYRPRSLNAAAESEDGPHLGDVLGEVDPTLVATPDRLTIREAARTLDDRRQRIVLWRFYEGCTQSEIGERLGIGQVQVSRLLRSALADIARALNAEQPTEVEQPDDAARTRAGRAGR